MRRYLALSALVALAMVACKKPEPSATTNAIAVPQPAPPVVAADPTPAPHAAAPTPDPTPAAAKPPQVAAPLTTTAATTKRARAMMRLAPEMVRSSFAKAASASAPAPKPVAPAPTPAPASKGANGGTDMHPYDDVASAPKVARTNIDMKPYD